MGVKVKDLAKMLNVSPSTVSLVLNNRPGISDATRNKVKEAVRELGYEELLAPEVEKKKKILFVVYQKHGKDAPGTLYFSQLFSEIIEGAESQARVKGCQLMISYIDQNNFKQEAERICREHADGILLLATEMEETQISAFLDLEIPIVVLDNYIEQNQFDCVTMNNEQGVYEAVSYLVSCGHKEIGYLHVVCNANNFMERYFGYRRAMEILKVPVRQDWIIEIETEGGSALYDELRKKLKDCRELPSAFFADNDIVAISAMKVLKELGYRIPEDVSIIGFDNMALSEMLEPPLTTIHIPKKTMGTAAINSIVEKMEGESKAVFRTVAPTSLVIRKSVKTGKATQE